jgi:hypothetical protein
MLFLLLKLIESKQHQLRVDLVPAEEHIVYLGIGLQSLRIRIPQSPNFAFLQLCELHQDEWKNSIACPSFDYKRYLKEGKVIIVSYVVTKLSKMKGNARMHHKSSNGKKIMIVFGEKDKLIKIKSIQYCGVDATKDTDVDYLCYSKIMDVNYGLFGNATASMMESSRIF